MIIISISIKVRKNERFILYSMDLLEVYSN